MPSPAGQRFAHSTASSFDFTAIIQYPHALLKASRAYNGGMEKPPPPDPTCPICKNPAQLARTVNALVEFWECETKHMFLVDKKPPPRVPAAAAASTPASAPAPAPATPEDDAEPKV